MNTVIEIIKFVFGGIGASCLFSWFFSWLYFKKGVSKELNKFAKVFEKMINTGLQYSLVLHKDTYTKEEVQKIVEEKVNEIITRRNIQLKQFSEDVKDS